MITRLDRDLHILSREDWNWNKTNMADEVDLEKFIIKKVNCFWYSWLLLLLLFHFMACDIHLNAYFFQAPPKAFYIPDFISVEEESYLLDHVCKLNL